MPTPGCSCSGRFRVSVILVADEYYANRRNQFWLLLGAVFDFDAQLPYPQRIEAVTDCGVALWDVVHSCRRAGSMDAKIDRKTLVVNDFEPLFASHRIERVFVNGLSAFELFERNVETTLPTVRLPSSSGALPMSLQDKLNRWRELA